MGKAKIFISYSTEDRDIASQISSDLRERGYEIFIDEDLLPGQEWQNVLTSALQASDVFITLITKNSVTSPYVMTELGSARAYMQSSKNTLIIPIIFDNIPIPTPIRDIQVIFAIREKISPTIDKIDKAITTFIGTRAAEEQKEAEVKERIELNAATFIQEAIDSLDKQEARNRIWGTIWYCLGYITLASGIAYGFFTIKQASETPNLEWLLFAYTSLKSIIIIGLLIACSKYAFTLGKSYMSEALKSADRIHAISFGKFYLRAFGEKATWTELKEVFQHWNIDRSSSFSGLDTNQFDPKFVEAVVEVAKAASSKAK